MTTNEISNTDLLAILNRTGKDLKAAIAASLTTYEHCDRLAAAEKAAQHRTGVLKQIAKIRKDMEAEDAALDAEADADDEFIAISLADADALVEPIEVAEVAPTLDAVKALAQHLLDNAPTTKKRAEAIVTLASMVVACTGKGARRSSTPAKKAERVFTGTETVRMEALEAGQAFSRNGRDIHVVAQVDDGTGKNKWSLKSLLCRSTGDQTAQDLGYRVWRGPDASKNVTVVEVPDFIQALVDAQEQAAA